MPRLILPFLGVVTVLTLVPGPDMALVIRNGVRGGAPAAWWTGLGCCTGICLWAVAAVLGLSALLAASAAAFTVVKLAGAAYLAYLGVLAWWRSRRVRVLDDVRELGMRELGGAARTAVVADRASAFRQGLLSNLLNPKIGLIFLTLIPQFVASGEPRVRTSAVLAGVFLAMAVLWWRLFSLGVGSLGSALARPRVRRVLDRVTGTILIGLGVRVAVSR